MSGHQEVPGTAATRPGRLWLLTFLFLAAVIISGGLIVWSRCGPTQPIEIVLPPGEVAEGSILIHGAVTSPGYYPFVGTDSLQALLAAAGGTTAAADPSTLELRVAAANGEPEPQKVDLNRAEAWLLQALPGIGEARAAAIIAYRRQHGPFRSIDELTEVEGIGPATFENIKHLITVAD